MRGELNMSRDIVILANSRKLRRRCVAGKDINTGEWIRLVADQDGNGLSLDTARNINCLSIYHVEGLRHVNDHGNPFHTENHLYVATRYLGNVANEGELIDLLDDPEYIFETCDKKIPIEVVSELGYSLQFVEVQDLYMGYDTWGKLRANFSYNGNRYAGIPITVPEVEARFENRGAHHVERYDYAYVTLSLGVIFEGYSYMLFSGLITPNDEG